MNIFKENVSKFYFESSIKDSTQLDTGLSPDNLCNEPLWIPVLIHRSLARPSLGVSELNVEFSREFAVVVTIQNVS